MADRVDIGFIWLDHGRGLEPPRQQTAGAAGVDLLAALSADEVLTLAPGKRADMAVLDRDPYAAGAAALREVKVEGVIFEGRFAPA